MVPPFDVSRALIWPDRANRTVDVEFGYDAKEGKLVETNTKEDQLASVRSQLHDSRTTPGFQSNSRVNCVPKHVTCSDPSTAGGASNRQAEGKGLDYC